MSLRRPRHVAALATVALMAAACTSSGGDSNSSSPSETAPAGSATSGASTPTRDPQSSDPNAPKPPKSAQYPTPGLGNGKLLKNQATVLNALPGSASKTCGVVGAKTTDLRAGSVAAGNFVRAHQAFSDQYLKTEVPQLNLYVIPKMAKGMRKVTITVDPFAHGKTRTVVSKDVEQADRSRYFAVLLPVAAPGRYRVTMTSSGGSGCFVVTFAK